LGEGKLVEVWRPCQSILTDIKPTSLSLTLFHRAGTRIP
jgi:hypothetical protein